MRSRRRNRGQAKRARLNRIRQVGELVVLVNDSWAYNKGLVPAIRWRDYESFDGVDHTKSIGANGPIIDRNGDSIRINLLNMSVGVYLGPVRVKLGRAGARDEHWGLTGGYKILYLEDEWVVQPGYVHFVLDGNIKTAYGNVISV